MTELSLLSSIQALDLSITLYLAQHLFFPTWLNLILTILGSVWFVFSFLSIHLFLRFYQSRSLSWDQLLPWLSFGCFMALTEALKIAAGRIRPEFFLQGHEAWQFFSFSDIFHSFPSSHAAIFIFLARYRNRQERFWYFLAIFTGLSRILLLKHFFLDIILGFLWGYLLGFLLEKLTVELKLRLLNRDISDLTREN
jgi:membrane-associated phospholipid phosphatase